MEKAFTEYEKCRLCPRECGVNRNMGERGVCGETSKLRIARAALHMWEEPCITGQHGSGTVFFAGCQMKCVFCQNYAVANSDIGTQINEYELAEIFLKLQEENASNINLVTPDHFVPSIAFALKEAKKQGLHIPIVYNTGSYVKVETLRMLEGLIDIYLPDDKYYEETLAIRYSRAKRYPKVAAEAICEMVRQTGTPVFCHMHSGMELGAAKYNALEENEAKEYILKRGTIVRHLLLPGELEDSKKVVRSLLTQFGDQIYLSLMNQYVPVGNVADVTELNRKVTEEEYEELIDTAIAAGIENGFVQEGGAAEESFIPDFGEVTI